MKNNKNHSEYYFKGVSKIANLINYEEVNLMAKELVKIKKNNGRVFFFRCWR